MTFHKPGLLPATIIAGPFLFATPAVASSFAVLGEASNTPSIIKRGEPVAPVVEARSVSGNEQHAGGSVYAIGQSIIAFGADAIPRSSEAFAAIDERQSPRRFDASAIPMVMRGGIVGDAFARPAAQPAVAATEPPPDRAPHEPDDAASDQMPSSTTPAAPPPDLPAAPTLEAR